jgi:hypothetical protein
MPEGIDVTRGVEIRRDRSTGVRVYMYINEPGVYLNAFGKPLAESFANKAGFPTERYSRMRNAREKIADFTRKMQHEMDVSSLTENREVVVARGGYTVYAMPYGNAIVTSDEGDNLTPTPIAQASALELLEALAPTPVAETKIKPEPAKLDDDDKPAAPAPALDKQKAKA